MDKKLSQKMNPNLKDILANFGILKICSYRPDRIFYQNKTLKQTKTKIAVAI